MDLTRIQQLVNERQQLKLDIEYAKLRIEEYLDPQILIELAVAGEKSAQVQAVVTVMDKATGTVSNVNRKYSVYSSSSDGKQYLDRMKLVEAGVTASQLASGTLCSKGHVGVTVKEIGKKQHED